MKKNLLAIIILILFPNISCFAQESNRGLESWKKGVVTITNSIIRSPYDKVGDYSGTGFLIDKQLGIVLTNKHIVNNVNVNDTYIDFFNGREIKATLLYSDPIQDFSFLKVDPTKIPTDAIEFKLQPNFPKVGESVTIIGNNENQGFSVQTGLITSIYETSSFFPNQALRISLNTRGGSSGSPIINIKGEVIAINYAIDSTYAYALPSAYFIEALSFVKNNQIPIRKDIGAIFRYVSLDKVNRYLNFPEAEIVKYLQDFPNSLNKAIIIDTIMPGTSIEKYVQASDIIWAINGKKIGPNLYELQNLINQTQGEKIKLKVYRADKLIEVEVPTYDLQKNVVKRMLVFEGAVFYEADDFTKLLMGVETGSVCLNNIDHNSGFYFIPFINFNNESTLHYLKITRLGNYDIKNLDSLIKAIPELIKKEHFIAYFQNNLGFIGFNNNIFTKRSEQFHAINYSGIGGEPLLLEYDEKSKSWNKQKILK